MAVKNKVPCTVTGAGAVIAKSIAWKSPVTPKMVAVCQQAPYQLADTPEVGMIVTVAVAEP